MLDLKKHKEGVLDEEFEGGAVEGSVVECKYFHFPPYMLIIGI